MKTLLKLICFLFLLSSAHSASSKHPLPKGINWYKGTVLQAMNLAKQKEKPLFLYWGAVWCPPCNQIKKTIFSQSQFHAESKEFINIYLDGDNTNAQKWGEHFGTVGYPTMMILNSKGEEITRMPTGLKVDQYVDLMKNVRKNLDPIENIIKKALAKKASIEEYKKLAGYSWGQDQKFTKTYLSKKQKEKTFLTLYKNSPSKPEYIKAHFFLQNLLKRDGSQKGIVSKNEKIYFQKILKQEEYQKGNFELIVYNVEEYEKLIDSKEFRSHYLALATKIRLDKKRNLDEKLASLSIDIALKKNMEVKKLVKSWALKAEQEAKGHYERQSAMSTAIWLLKSSGQANLAKKLARREIKKSQSPYYFMSYLGGMEIASKNIKTGLSLYQQAWNASEGHATRFQWGSSYIRMLLKHDSSNIKSIRKTTLKVFDELLKDEDAFLGRNTRRLKKLATSYGEWRVGNPEFYAAITESLKIKCSLPKKIEIQNECQKWLVGIK